MKISFLSLRKGLQNAVQLIFIGVLVFQVSGCALLFGAAAGVGGFAWVKGKLVKDINAPVDKVHNAALAGLKKLELPITLDRKDKFTAKIESKFADGTNVWVDIDSVTERTSKIHIRVGVLGDQERSSRILASIEKAL
jgi:hypothetical protein